MTSLEAFIILSSVEGLGIQTVRKLLGVFEKPEALFEIHEFRELAMSGQISEELAVKILEARPNVSPQKIIDEVTREGITLIHFLDPVYPKNLQAIYDPPLFLYVKGRLIPEDHFALGVVGSRFPTAYGIQIARQFSGELAQKGMTIVSGLALGIDRASHEGALQAKGRTIAVLGSGLDVIYPQENEAIYEAISENGAVISEFPLGTEPRHFHFPKRNRIIAGLSLGVLVVEAGEKSGSLITARLAAEEGREVYAIPGRVDTPLSRGTHRLIQEGAKLVISSDQILEDLYPVLKGMESESKSEIALPVETEESQALLPEEMSVLAALGEDSLAVDDLASKLSLDSPKILEILTRLEMGSRVKRLWGGRFAKMGVYLK